MKNKWYFAYLIEFPIIRDKKTLKLCNQNNPMYWENLILVKAKDSEMAYKKAIQYGREGEYKTINTDGDYVEWKFAGIRELVEVYGDLADLEELAYSEEHCRTFKDIRKLIPLKKKLGIFSFEMRKKKIKNKRSSKPKKIKVPKYSMEEAEKVAKEILGDINKNI